MWEIEVERQGSVAVIELGAPGASAHLDLERLEELVEAADQAASAEGVERLLLRSNGAGRGLMGARLDDYDALSDREQALAFARRGCGALARLAAVPAITIAGIEGPWLAEGCELALACDVRACTAEGRLGLPQPGIGHVPGWGGVVRLTRRAGPARALSTLSLAAGLSAGDAFRMGVVDAVERGPLLAERVAELVPRPARWPLFDRLLLALPPLRRMALSRSVSGTAARPPARERLARMVELAVAWPEDEALEQEREVFADTVASAEARGARAAIRGVAG
jgi:enoyl-CoA hydratase